MSVLLPVRKKVLPVGKEVLPVRKKVLPVGKEVLPVGKEVLHLLAFGSHWESMLKMAQRNPQPPKSHIPKSGNHQYCVSKGNIVNRTWTRDCDTIGVCIGMCLCCAWLAPWPSMCTRY